MKKIVMLTAALMAVSTGTMANEVKFVAEGANNEVQHCINAASGKMSVAAIAAAQGVSVATLDRQVQCNGVAISTFAKQYQTVTVTKSDVTTENNYALNVAHADKDAQLCTIAASGDMAKLQRVTRAQGITVKHFVKYSSCNNQSVKDFVKQYGGKTAAKDLTKFI